jgi:predicted amidophosphoribosyltransferase
MAKDDTLETLAGFAAGIIGLAILAEILKPKCPICKSPVERNAPFCSNCGTPLRWR